MTDSDPAGTEGEPPSHRFIQPASHGLDDEARHPTQRLRRALAGETTGRPGEQTAGAARSDGELEFETLSESAPLGPQARWTRRITRRTAITGVALAALVAAATGTLVLTPATRHPTVAALAPSPPPIALPSAPPIRPSARDDAAMAYDSADDSVILFGGLVIDSEGLNALGDTWSWDGTRWTELHPTASPPALSGALLGYDPASAGLVLIGGDISTPEGQLEETNATWTWGGSGWTAEAAAALPASDLPTALATDNATRQLILVTTGAGCQGFETWEWGGSAWVLLHPAASPPATFEAGLVFDPRTDGLDLFPGAAGCTGGDETVSATPPVWSWNGSTWSTAAAQPDTVLTGSWELTTSSGAALVVTSEGTYQWSGGDGGGWSQVSTSPAAGDAAIAYDAADDQVVLFGGICSSCDGIAVPDTWTWAGNWTLRAMTTSSPTPTPKRKPAPSPAAVQTPKPTMK
jgi:hypothetical protein